MTEKGPFSLYDFMGYFFPGALALYLLILSQNDIASYFSKDFFLDNERRFIDLPFYMVLFYVVISYCLGHFLSFFSTLTIEKYTRIVYEDPSKILLSEGEFKPMHISFSTLLFEGKFKLKHILKKMWKFKWRIILFILIWPLIIYDWLLVRLLGYNHDYLRKIDQPYKNLIIQRINKIFHELGHSSNVCENIGSNYHRFLIHYNYEFTKHHGHKLMNYVSLYGFLRVITLISCLFFDYIFVSYIFTHPFQPNLQGVKNFAVFAVCLLSVASMTFVFYLGYLKFYRRYTLENLMLILIVDKNNC